MGSESEQAMKWNSEPEPGDNIWVSINVRVPHHVGRALLAGWVALGGWRDHGGYLEHDRLPGAVVEYNELPEPIVAMLAREAEEAEAAREAE